MWLRTKSTSYGLAGPCLFFGLLLLLGMLSGCGFQPRAEVGLPAAMQTTWIKSPNNDGGLAKLLELRLQSQGIELIELPKKGAASLVISKAGFRRQILSLNLQGRASEYQLHYNVIFSLSIGAGKTLLENQSLSSQRDFTFDENNVLGKSGEEELLRESMVKDMVQRILRRISAAKGNDLGS